jgi:hypothetical protein
VTAPTGGNVLELRGLSTDEKPTETISGYGVANGSTFYEIDTGKLYMFNGTSSAWVEQ